MRPLPDPNADFAKDYMEVALGFSLHELEEEVRASAKMHILDTIGVALAAPCSVGAEFQALLDIVSDWGGEPESTVWSGGQRVPSWAAAFVNGALAKGLDYDTTHPTAMLHPSGPVLPAALAVAEARHVSGEELLAAMIAGEELIVRLGRAVTLRPEGWLRDWHTTVLLGGFGAAAAASRLFGLNLAQAVGALGTALTTAGGTMELGFGTGSTLRLVYNAFPARDGVMAATMAAHGIIGPRTPFEGTAGLFAVHFAGSYDLDCLYEGLGDHYELVGTGFKPWPSCAATIPYIEVALGLSGGGLRAEEVAGVRIKVNQVGDMLCHPLGERQRPATVSDAKFSLPFAVGLALSHGEVRIQDYTEDGIRAPDVLAMAALVESQVDPEMAKLGPRAATVEVTLREGPPRSGSVRVPYGLDRSRAMTSNALIDKFRGCADAGGFSKRQTDTIVEMVMGIDELEDAATLAAALVKHT